MGNRVDEFIDEKMQEGQMSDEDRMAALNMSFNGDTDDESESGKAPEPAAKETAAAEDQEKEAKAEEQDKEEKPVVQARDGKHTIPYSELEKSRTEAQEAKSQLEELAAKNSQLESMMAELQTAKKQDREEDTTENVDEVLSDFQEEFPELAKVVVHLLDKERAAHQAEIAALKQDFEPIKQKQEQSEHDRVEAAKKAHFDAIYNAYDNADSIVASNEFSAWKATLPEYVQAGITQTLERGTATEVVNVLDDFSKAGDKDPAKVKANLEKQADEAEKKAKESVPHTLSDIPGSTKMHHDEGEAIRNMSNEQLFIKYMNMPRDKVMDTLDRVL